MVCINSTLLWVVRATLVLGLAVSCTANDALAQAFAPPSSANFQTQPGYPALFPAPAPARLPAVENLPTSAGDMRQLQNRLGEAEEQIRLLQEKLDEKQPDGIMRLGANNVAPPPAEPNCEEMRKQFNKFYDEKKSAYPNVAITGVFQADCGFFTQDANSIAAHGDLQDGADFRRARLAAKGSVTETIDYMMQMDFAFFGRPTFTDVWVEQKELPVLGNARFGQWKQPFSLEVVSSFRYTTFMERSVLFQPFTPFRHLGAGFYNYSDNLNWTWAASGFRSGQDQYGGSISDDGGWGTSERITHLFYYDEPAEGRYYLHGGLGHFYNNPPRDIYNFRTIPELYIGDVGNATQVGTSGQPTPGPNNGTPFFVATGPLNIQNFNVLGAEVLWVNGPLSFQSEAMVALVDQTNNPNATLGGAYGQIGYFLTGEHRPYDRKKGCIDRVMPFSNFFIVDTANDGRCAGWGAWEVAARLSHIDLNDQNIQGGTLTDFTAGLNWYWNPYAKMVFNYIHAWNDSTNINLGTGLPVGPNVTDMYAARIQVDF